MGLYYYGFVVNEGIGLILVIQTFYPSTFSVLYNKDVYPTSVHKSNVEVNVWFVKCSEYQYIQNINQNYTKYQINKIEMWMTPINVGPIVVVVYIQNTAPTDTDQTHSLLAMLIYGNDYAT